VPPALLEEWIAQGVTPQLAALRSRSAYGRLSKSEDHPHEASWSALLQGCAPRVSGEWGRQVYDADTYRVEVRDAYSLEHQPPFYALTNDIPLVIFDLPHVPIINSLMGVQLLGWGLVENLSKCASRPNHLLTEIVQRHGMHPFFGGNAARVIAQEHDGTVSGFRLPSVYDPEALDKLEEQLISAIEQRTDILLDLMARVPWAFVFAAVSELHLAMHMLWHKPSRLTAIARAFDISLGRMLNVIPDDTYLAVFSISGMATDYTDLPTTLFLPEFLYRLQFGEPALAAGKMGASVPTPATHYRKHWKNEVWALRTARGTRELESPDEQELRNDPFDWSPLNWYRVLWPRMRAFALPSFSHGMVRINLRGRDRAGIVEPADYARYCDELTDAIWGLCNARSGRPIIKSIKRTRTSPNEDGENLPPADLMITWNPEEPTDTVESPLVGRIGPVPRMRTGGHVSDGFCMLNGSDIEPGAQLRRDARVTDLTATLFKMLNIAPPPYLEGRSLI